jgi:hypothetical protein
LSIVSFFAFYPREILLHIFPSVAWAPSFLRYDFP